MSGCTQCTYCYGSGEVQEIGQHTCYDCMGNGSSYGPNGYDIFKPCRTCNGTGQVTDTRWVTCPRCFGMGYF